MREYELAPYLDRVVGPGLAWSDRAEKCASFAPTSTSDYAAVMLNDEVGLIIDQLRINAEYMPSDGIGLRRRVVASAQLSTGSHDQILERRDVGVQSGA